MVLKAASLFYSHESLLLLKFIYFLATQIYYGAIRIASLFDSKAKKAIAGRKSVFMVLEQQKFTRNEWIWVHCASLGEFEQGRPLIEKIKKEQPAQKILLSFFSPSGYEIRKNYVGADLVIYLPFDSPKNASRFLKLLRPKLAVFVKYEFWYFYLNSLKKENIPTLLVSGIFRKNQIFFKPYGGFFRNILRGFDWLFLQNEESHNLLKIIGLSNYSIAGDTRVDRVLDIAKQKKNLPLIADFCDNKKVFIIGSSWQPDEAILLPFINHSLPADWKVIIAQHEIKEQRLQEIEKRLNLTCIRYSKLQISKDFSPRVLLIDNIGMLAHLYQFGRIAYIGGGFGAGIHNTLEPIAFGLPVIFGPKYQKFEEATFLIEKGGAFAISDTKELQAVFKNLLPETPHKAASQVAQSYINLNKGATNQIFNIIEKNGWL